MDITIYPVKVKDLIKNYTDNTEDGVTGYDGKLDIRPPYQREFVYKDKQQEAVIDTIFRGLPLNVMYWAKTSDGRFEIIDGQQRSISICKYINGEFAYKGRYYHNMCSDEIEKLMEYELNVYVCDGLESEKLDWFRTINIAAEQLTDQELRNAVYSGTWLTDAKKYFSKTNCPAQRIAGAYLNGTPIRQDYLQTVLSWIADKEKTTIENYMAIHQKDINAAELWRYFQSVITWIETIFTNKSRQKFMKGIPWGILYNQYSDKILDTREVENKISELWKDDDVTKKNGVFPYIITGEEKYLSIRKFTENQKLAAYEKQAGICPHCGKHFEFDEMEGDHIKPWAEGGHTVIENCQMLCKNCNRIKGKR